MRNCCILLSLAGTVFWGTLATAGTLSPIIPETTAARHGLTRAWMVQVQVDRSRGRVTHLLLDRGTLFVQTDRAVVHALDAETGQTLWVSQIGRRDHPSLAAGANENLLAVVNGAYLYVVNRETGKLLWKNEIDGAAGAGPALSSIRAYVPLVNGKVLAYRLTPVVDPLAELGRVKEEAGLTEQQKAAREQERREEHLIHQEFIPPLACQSFGRSLVQPLVTKQNKGEEYVAWPTDRGILFVGVINRTREDFFAIRFRLQTDEGIAARPTYRPADPADPTGEGVIYIPSRDGFVYAISETTGSSLWRFPTGEPIIEPAAIVGDDLYVPTQLGGLYCLDGATGQEKWWAPQVVQFIAASKDHAYVVDKLDRILVLDTKTGARVDTIPTGPLPLKYLNMQTDRIYLASKTGLIQCLHEVQNVEPIQHHPTRPAVAAEPAEAEPPPVPEPQPPAPVDDPFNRPPPPPAVNPPAGGDDPFGNPPADNPPAGEDDPFADPFR